MTTFEKLAIRIKKDTGLELENFKRTYAGIHMRGSGAFVWVSNIIGSNADVCSTETASSLLTKKEPIKIMEDPTISGIIELI